MEKISNTRSTRQTKNTNRADGEPSTKTPGDEGGRTARKRRAITEAATDLFLDRGYAGTSMDQIATRAAVSKQTVYKQFEDKDQLFRAIVADITSTVDSFISDVDETLLNPLDLEADLRALAYRYLASVMQTRVIRLRRLVIAEAGRFPELGRAYYEQGPQRVLAMLAARFQQLATQGQLRLQDPILAANHFAFLVLSIPLDRALVCGDDALPAADEMAQLADAGVRVFLSAYGNGSTPSVAD